MFPDQVSTPNDVSRGAALELDGHSAHDVGDRNERGDVNSFHTAKRLKLSDDDGIEEINRLPENWHHEET